MASQGGLDVYFASNATDPSPWMVGMDEGLPREAESLGRDKPRRQSIPPVVFRNRIRPERAPRPQRRSKGCNGRMNSCCPVPGSRIKSSPHRGRGGGNNTFSKRTHFPPCLAKKLSCTEYVRCPVFPFSIKLGFCETNDTCSSLHHSIHTQWPHHLHAARSNLFPTISPYIPVFPIFPFPG